MKSTHLTAVILVLLGLWACSDDAPDLRIDDNQPPEEEETDTTPVFDVHADWMRQLLYETPGNDLTLRHLCLPGSHDAGTYILQNCSVGANACNTQTQHRDTRRQLEDGIRVFDIRPVLLNNVYFTQHTTGCGGLGCKGDGIANMLNQVRDFLDGHAELVVLEFSHWCDTGPNDASFQELVTNLLGPRMYRDSTDNSVPFHLRPLEDIVSPLGATGKALALFHGIANTEQNRAAGLFASSYLPKTGSYANAQTFEAMKADQFGKYAGFANQPHQRFEISWTLTMNADMSVACAFPWTNPPAIADLAESANSQLETSVSELIASGQITPGRIPNVIYVDFCETFVTDQCVRISRLNTE